MKKSVSIAFTGDIGFDRYMNGKWNDGELLSEGILNFLTESNHVVANVEGAMIDYNGPNTKGMFMHTMNPGARVFLKKIHADIWNINNNHSMDAGAEGLFSTMNYAKECNAVTLGGGSNIEAAAEPLYLEEACGIGLLSIGYQPLCVPATETEPGVLSWDEFERIRKSVNEIRKKCRWCILCIHGGEEFCNIPMPYIRDRYLKYLDMGVDIIVAHHPHVPQNYETFENGKIIFYSLGNFIFDTDYQRAQFNTDKGVLLRLNLSETGFSFDAIGTKLDRGSERLTDTGVPGIFHEINSTDYERLLPAAALAMVIAEKKRQINMKPDVYTDYTEEQWKYFFDHYTEIRKARENGKPISDTMRFDGVIVQTSMKFSTCDWRKAPSAVVSYIEEQL